MPIKDYAKKLAYNRQWARNNRDKLLEYERNRVRDPVQLTEWKLANPDKVKLANRKSHLRTKFGITLEQYNDLLNKHNSCCHICKRPATHFKTSLHVDHDHRTQEIRGLLCFTCNRNLIGRHRDPLIFKSAFEYLSGPFTGWFAPVKKKKRKARK
jgi:hypothetical protein